MCSPVEPTSRPDMRGVPGSDSGYRVCRDRALATVRLTTAYDCQARVALRLMLWSIPFRKRIPCGTSSPRLEEAHEDRR
jgi:hypothetical protein